jgi:hypothetical protein
MEGWIDITEYATKYGVSASTLRRRIRCNSISYKMERGKYLLQDTSSALNSAPLFSRVKAGQLRQTVMPATQIPIHRAGQGLGHDPVGDLMNLQMGSGETGSYLKEDNERLSLENRRLKAQIEELQTLVKVLEAEVGTGAEA